MGRPAIGDRAMTATERSRRWRALRSGSVTATKPASNETSNETELLDARERIADLERRLKDECANNRTLRAKIIDQRDLSHMEVANGQRF